MRHLKTLILTMMAAAFAGCGNYLNVQPQGEVIPKTDEEFASLIHNRLREIEGGGDENVIGNMDVLMFLEGCADNLDANIMAGSNLPFFAGEEIDKRQSYYSNSWETVRDCNIVIDNLGGKDSDIARGSVSAAYAMKGIIYYNLMREFCQPYDEATAGSLPGIPLVDNFDINYRPSRGTLSQTFGYTEKLFDSALALKPTDSKYMVHEMDRESIQSEAGVLVRQMGQCNKPLHRHHRSQRI